MAYIAALTLIIWGLIASNLTVLSANSSANIPAPACEVHYQPGDVIIGGLFPIVPRSPIPCDGDTRTNFIGLAESMTYAVNMINNRTDVLPQTRLGYEVRNDCADEDISLWTMMTMATSQGNGIFEDSCPNHARGNTDQVIAVIGPSFSSTALVVARVGNIFSIPVVSYSATSDELSEESLYPFFYRTVPPDMFQVGAIMDLLQFYNWRYVALFYSIDSYGIHGARQIMTLADEFNVCIPINLPVSSDATQDEIKEIAQRLIIHHKISVIILFTNRLSAIPVVQSIKQYNIDRRFVFIGSDGWGPEGDPTHTFSDILLGSLFVRFHATSSENFHDYYKELPNNRQHASHWYIDKLEDIAATNNCTDWKSCPIPEPPILDIEIINGVFAVAYALDKSIKINCDDGMPCSEALVGSAIEKELRNISFPSEDNTTFEFYSKGDSSGRFQIWNWQFIDGEYKIVNVGLWDPDEGEANLQLDDDMIQWGTLNGDVPTSLCYEECRSGYISVPLEMPCCFGCQSCLDYEIVSLNNDNMSICVECPVTEWPDNNFTTCIPIYPSYVSNRNIVSVIIILMAIIGLIFAGFTMIGLCYYSKHPLVKASSRELSSINIVGLAYSCVIVLLLFARPTTVKCIITSISISTSSCMIFTPMLLKVNRIWRIFNNSKGNLRPRFASPKDQVIIASTIIFFQVKLLFWGFFYPELHRDF